MGAFYEELWVRGAGTADALWSAQRRLRDAGRPPAEWAGWRLVGDPGR